MKFTYDGYRELLELLFKNGYKAVSYEYESDDEKIVVLRHDVDRSIQDAVRLSEIEKEYGISAVYFILLSSDFYNVCTAESAKAISKICENGGTIGLHFDETKYDVNDISDMVKHIENEAAILRQITGLDIKTVSMHRPSKTTLESDIVIPGIINSYSQKYFKEYKYLSDSRMHWRENAKEVIESGKYNKMQILTHAFWYHDKDYTPNEILCSFIDRMKWNTYRNIVNNTTNPQEFITEDDVRKL
ncbi:MAG: hypothetical protein HDT39_08970 [Lachnospiraceae bacterium]|nr:hypothetical protein [Lachnospiraceae bacterium]